MADLCDLLDELPKCRATLTEDKAAILAALDESERGIVETKNFDGALVAFKDWILALVKNEPIPASIQGLNFGLHEPEGNFGLYVTGSNSYNAEDPDWACANDYWPEGRYCRLEIIHKLSEELSDTDTEAWQVAQAIVTAVVKAFFQQYANDFIAITGLKRVHIATGFDDGDLYNVLTPMTPNQ